MDMAKRRKAKTTTRARARRVRKRSDKTVANGLTHRELTERFNALVPRANRLGIAWARRHSSAFETKALGVRMLARLEQAIAAAARCGPPTSGAVILWFDGA
jgi:hypothetical protein